MRKRKPYTVCVGCSQTVAREAVVLRPNGSIKESICTDCRKLRFNAMRVAENKRVPDSYRIYLKDSCDRCGFKGLACQLDIDHIDGNSLNNQPDNLRTLCANCHRLATYSVEAFKLLPAMQ